MYIFKSQGQSMVQENHHLTIPEMCSGRRDIWKRVKPWTVELDRQRDQQGQVKEIQFVWNFEKQVFGASSWCCMCVRRGWSQSEVILRGTSIVHKRFGFPLVSCGWADIKVCVAGKHFKIGHQGGSTYSSASMKLFRNRDKLLLGQPVVLSL